MPGKLQHPVDLIDTIPTEIYLNHGPCCNQKSLNRLREILEQPERSFLDQDTDRVLQDCITKGR